MIQPTANNIQRMRIFVISLPHAAERRERVKSIFEATDYEFSFFDAVDGKEGLPERLENRINDRYRMIFRSRPLSRGERGCFASHFLLWEKCVELDQPIIILEDDFVPTKHFVHALNHLSELIDGLDYLKLERRRAKWLMLDKVAGFERRFVYDNSCGATGYILTPNGAKKLLSHCEQWLCAVDNYISECFRHSMPSYNINPGAIQALHDMPSFIQVDSKTSVPIYFKLTRELNRFYRFLRMTVSNQRIINGIKKTQPQKMNHNS
ncbi:glycosyltransferase family 25 protein [Vibrio sp. SCSIO 43133]|uniref:glycosyltransferase family 25 protein n=1 Tax=Vibrio sp. SCSIO 43133 TaxID=2802577 RepID=UPI002074F9BB|nr:glycosyltransferase family 25 protein [Vibrio sp. SCSIO 43133]USE00349.1 glycosyltransferase family 25 protein [Vibrio sp. SCSIO 43133]